MTSTMKKTLSSSCFVLQFIFSRKFIFKCVQYIAFISAMDDNYMQNTLINNIIYFVERAVLLYSRYMASYRAMQAI